MNSIELISTNTEKYSEFFADKPIVISMPFCMNWCGDLADTYTWINIKQKIPLRIYASIKPWANQWYWLKDFYYYSLSTKTFEKDRAYDYIPYAEMLVKYFNDRVKEYPIEDCGYEISFFSELPKGVWIGFDQIILSLITSLIYRVTKWYSDRYRYDLIDMKLVDRLLDPLENQLLQTVVELENMIIGYSFRSGYVMTSFFDWAYPFVTIQSKNTAKKYKSDLSSIFVAPIDKIIPNLPNRPSLPFDYWLAYTGKPITIQQVITNIQTNTSYLLETMCSVWERLREVRPWFEESGAYEDFEHMTQDNITIYQETLSTVSFELLSMFFKVLANGYTESNLKYFIYAIWKVNMANAILRRTSSYLRAIIDSFYIPFGWKWKMLGVGFNDTNIMGWCLLFVTPAETFREQVAKALEIAGVDMIKLIEIYTNWKDGYMKSWLIFEHDIENKLFSEFVDNKTVIVGPATLLTKSWLSKKSTKQADIIIDITCMKLIIGWKSLDSDNIPSQVTTIETLILLLKSPGERVSNRYLPKSSYSDSKNQFMQKIAKPLINVVKSFTKKLFHYIARVQGLSLELN